VRKLLTVSLVLVIVLGLMSGVAMALPCEENFGGEGEAFENTGDNHFTHKDGDVRFNWRDGDPAFVVPGDGGEALDEDSAVYEHGDEIIIRPLR